MKKWIRRITAVAGYVTAGASLLEYVPGTVGVVAGVVGGWLTRWLPRIVDELAD